MVLTPFREKIVENNGYRRLDAGHSARNDAGIVPAAHGQRLVFVAGDGDAILFLRDGRRGLDRDAHHDGHTGGNAAEHAARTLAMQTATDNGNEILQELTLEYNKGRQQKITSEILDLVGGSMQ